MREFFSTLNPASPTWDLFLILFFVIAAFLYGITVGRARIVVQIVASYMAMAVLASAPFLDKLEARTPLNHTVFYLVAFLAVFLALFMLLSRSAFHQHLSEARGKWWDVLVLSVVQVGFLTSIILSSMSGGALGHLSPVTLTIFANGPAPFIWTVLPIGALVAIRGRRKIK
jgi:quinol-cytochrome oxidoreductase complex cytochrome b subunit